MIVLDDAEFPQALMGAGYVCSNAGQGCVLTTRLLVPRSRYDEALSRPGSRCSATCPTAIRRTGTTSWGH